MKTFQNFVAAFIEDVNREDGLFLQFSGGITNLLFLMIKWAGIPFMIYILFEFSKL